MLLILLLSLDLAFSLLTALAASRFLLGLAGLTLSRPIATEPLGAIRVWELASLWSPINQRASVAIGLPIAKWAPNASWCWGPHYAFLRAGAENWPRKSDDNRGWVDHCPGVTTWCDAWLVPGVGNGWWAGHLARIEALIVAQLSVGRHCSAVEVDLKQRKTEEYMCMKWQDRDLFAHPGVFAADATRLSSLLSTADTAL